MTRSFLQMDLPSQTSPEISPFIQRQLIETADIFSERQQHACNPHQTTHPVPAFVHTTVPVLYR